MKLMRLITCSALLVFGAGVLSARAQATAPAACPWLTQGVAARVLGGDVSVDVHVSDAGEGYCSFARNTDATVSLKIDVSKTAVAACGAGAMKLKGIGNEAVRCALAAADGRNVQKIASRVRDRFFTLTLSQGKGARADESDDLRNDDLEQAAESVSGNLF